MKKLAFKKAKENPTGKGAIRKQPLKEIFAETDAIGDDVEKMEKAEPTIYEENAIEVMLSGEVPDTYSVVLHDM